MTERMAMTDEQKHEHLLKLVERSTSPDGFDHDALAFLDVDPDTLSWEYRSGDDGAGSIWQDADGKQHSEFRPCSQWRRAVGSWERV